MPAELPLTEVRALLRTRFSWRGDRTDHTCWADVSGWWRDPTLLRALGPALAELAAPTTPTVVVAPQSRGYLLGTLVAAELGVGFVEIRKNSGPSCDSDAWLTRTTPPDYRDRHLTLGFRRDLIRSGDRVLLVDEWIETGTQALTIQRLVHDAGAHWSAATTVVDALRRNFPRHRLHLTSLLHLRDLSR